MPPVRKPIFCYVTDRRALEAARASSPCLPQAKGGRYTSSADQPASSADSVDLLRHSIRRAVAGGAAWVQIREKDLDGRALGELARFAVAESGGAGARVLINDRLDVAIAANAAGVHLGEKSLPLDAVAGWRRAAGRNDFLIGVSTHSVESARAAERGGADYIFFGPVFATPSKAEYGAPQGIERLREICSAVAIPVIAIGGVNLENARACLAVGAAGIAAIRLFQEAGNVAEMLSLLGSST